MKILIVIGTRPQIIKASILKDAFHKRGLETILVHTGQHYTNELSELIMKDVGLSVPDHNLSVGSGNYRYQISEGFTKLNPIVKDEKPDWVVCIGDSNPALVGCLSAISNGLPLAHCEAGLRSGNVTEPEEKNRLFIDSLSDLLFCSTHECIENLRKEGLSGNAILTGDLLLDTWHKYAADTNIEVQDNLGEGFLLFTTHRKSNAYNRKRFTKIVSILLSLKSEKILWPIHPGVEKELISSDLMKFISKSTNIEIIPSVSYTEMKYFLTECKAVITDSVGLQIESYFAQKKSILLRNESEYEHLELIGWSKKCRIENLGPTEFEKNMSEFLSLVPKKYEEELFGDGNACESMLKEIVSA